MVKHCSHTFGNSSGLLCFCFQPLVCVQITLDKQSGLTLCRQLCRSLSFSHGKHLLQQSEQEQKILNTSLLTPYCGPHTFRVLTVSRHPRRKAVTATLPWSKLQLKLKITFVINQTIKHVQPDLFTSRNHFAFLPVVSLRDTCFI